jgi:hypothetical protein
MFVRITLQLKFSGKHRLLLLRVRGAGARTHEAKSAVQPCTTPPNVGATITHAHQHNCPPYLGFDIRSVSLCEPMLIAVSHCAFIPALPHNFNNSYIT